MSQRGTSAEILFLREQIAAIEDRGGPPGTARRFGERRRTSFGEGCSLDRVLDGGLSCGALHEIVPGCPGDAVAAAGFAAALSARFALEPLHGFGAIRPEAVAPDRRTSHRDLREPGRAEQKVSPSAHLARRAGEVRSIVWILEDGARREWGIPYGPGLRFHGLDPALLVLVQARNGRESLWSLEEAVKCRAVAAAVAEIWTLEPAYDLTASRRLVLAARESGTPALLVAPRLARGVEGLSSAAATRFEIFSRGGPCRVPAGRGPPIPGPAAWSVRIVKARAGSGSYGFDRDRHLAVVWDHEKGCFRDAFSLALPALPRNRSASSAQTRRGLVRIV